MFLSGPQKCTYGHFGAGLFRPRAIVVIHTRIGFVWTVRPPDAATDVSASGFTSPQSSAAVAGEPSTSRTPPSQLQHFPPGSSADVISSAVGSQNITASSSNQTEIASGIRSSRQQRETPVRASSAEQRKKSGDDCCIS